MTLTAWRRTLWGMAVLIVLLAVFSAPAYAAAPASAPAAAGGGADTWISYLNKLWPIVVTVAGLLIAGALLGLATRFATVVEFKLLKGRVDTLEDKLVDHNGRISKVEDQCQSPPTRLELSEEIAELSERMKGVEVGLQGVSAQGKTTNDYLHMIIEKGFGK